jgi:hypothetical protein
LPTAKAKGPGAVMLALSIAPLPNGSQLKK